ncbi:flagellar basal body-associated FliL family protein [Kineococcus rubinsiae]|uniref:flagellar basal body-associated FliL family protein n=1 Tax=Kineococcus rubinsiae TaxID=2609562 RepID=UPI00143043E5|nr:flagellar basal body-associated FliL family protein [Kineococcus rubinsiae]NIZ93170.1 flagellar basal body protein FliL [Kineococcus rubinsiae]
MAKKPKVEGAEASGRKKKPIIILALGAVLLLGAGGGTTFLLTKGDSAAAAETKVEKVEPLVPGEVVPLDPITINLADGRYLKLGVALQGVLVEAGGEGASGPDGSKALDLAIAEFTGLTMAELSNPEQREKYKDELQEKIITAYKEKDAEGVEHETVMGIYLTQFVMQ